jgi:pyridoxal phosphate enzyme (YggS family)
MLIDQNKYLEIVKQLSAGKLTLVAVSKTKPVEAIEQLYNLGQRDFGENYVQELVEKQERLPGDIRWHFIGHLQRNKVKYIVPFAHLIHAVDSLSLLEEINKQARKAGRVVAVLLQVHIAQEETKFGLNEKELENLLNSHHLKELQHVRIEGLMGMASLTEDGSKVRSEFRYLAALFRRFSSLHPGFSVLSMGMSSDYLIAIEEGSTLVRIGSLLFGQRQ